MADTLAQATPEQQQDFKNNEKDLNFRNLQVKYQRDMERETAARMEAERVNKELMAKQHSSSDEDDDSEPYIDHKKLTKKLERFGEKSRQETQGEIQKAVQMALQDERKQNWLRGNPDFYDVLQNAEKLAQKDPELAETILNMPDGFERQKLVYRSIKSHGLHEAPRKESSIQEKVDANRRSPYYQPTGVNAAPYAQASDFSPTGQKQAYQKMLDLKNKLRI